ncbi:DUF1007 family protein [Salidesulfovibrio onnuriiensis]|uniref:HoxN/HupN/NixA family nickel/cobalt transporter n=1 Tax=Salidesulfovibrio onnuriiensis TaxID=2583823 RepID=UPI0011CC48A1|nr:DUF1007 family protein [Salidesulfovibrio onnuriiensis]
MHRTLNKTLLTALFLLLGLATMAQAHPHVFVDASPTMVINEHGLAGIREHWLFDDMFTSAILSDIGVDPTTVNTESGQSIIRDGAFAYLKNFDYFTAVHLDGKPVPIPEATDFAASITEDNRLVYDFFLPLDIPVSGAEKLRIVLYDKEYYTDILLKEDEISFEVDGQISVSHTIGPAKDLAYWGGYVIPQGINLNLSPTGTAEPAPPPVAVKPAPKEDAGLNLRQTVMKYVTAQQKALKKQMTALGNDIREKPLGPAFWMFLLLSFFYGGVHAIGPGHGKTVVCSYFLARPGSLWLGAVMGNAITFVHVGSAVLVVTGAYLLLGQGMGGFHQADRYIQPASYALLTLVGLGLAVKIALDLRKGGLLRGPACPVDTRDMARAGDTRSVLLVSFVTGIVPCPGAAVILAFAIGLNILGAGIAAMLALALGMGLTTTLFAWTAVSARGLALSLSSRNRTFFNWLYAAVSVCGALTIALFGAAMLTGSLS